MVGMAIEDYDGDNRHSARDLREVHVCAKTAKTMATLALVAAVSPSWPGTKLTMPGAKLSELSTLQPSKYVSLLCHKPGYYICLSTR